MDFCGLMYVENHHHGPGCSGDQILQKRDNSGAGLGRPHVSTWRHSGRVLLGGDQVVDPGRAAGIIFPSKGEMSGCSPRGTPAWNSGSGFPW